jgi:hypothetical protein
MMLRVPLAQGASGRRPNILYGALIIIVVSIYRRDRRLRDQV